MVAARTVEIFVRLKVVRTIRGTANKEMAEFAARHTLKEQILGLVPRPNIEELTVVSSWESDY